MGEVPDGGILERAAARTMGVVSIEKTVVWGRSAGKLAQQHVRGRQGQLAHVRIGRGYFGHFVWQKLEKKKKRS